MKKDLLLCCAALFFANGCTTSGNSIQVTANAATHAKIHPPATVNDLYGVWHSSVANPDIYGVHHFVLSKDHQGLESMIFGESNSKQGATHLIQFFGWEFDEAKQELTQKLYVTRHARGKELIEETAENGRQESAKVEILKLGDLIAGIKLTMPDGKKMALLRSTQEAPANLAQWREDFFRMLGSDGKRPPLP